MGLEGIIIRDIDILANFVLFFLHPQDPCWDLAKSLASDEVEGTAKNNLSLKFLKEIMYTLNIL